MTHLKREVVYQLHRLTFLMDKKADELLTAKCDLTFSQFLVLMAITKHESMNQKSIAAFLRVTEAAVSRMIETLRTKGLVETQSAPDNLRVNHPKLTDKGNTLLEKSVRHIDGELVHWFTSVSDEEQTRLITTLQNLITHFPA